MWKRDLQARTLWKPVNAERLPGRPGLPKWILPVIATGLLLCIPALQSDAANPRLVKSFETLMEIPDIKTVSASEAHLFVLSGREGLIVFRASADSLQWLYSSAGLANRGDRLVSDIRFSYLFGRDGRLTVIEPTSVLGVYSSTRLDDDPNDVVRLGTDLYLADEHTGITRLSLESSESVDQPPDPAFEHDRPVISLAGIADQLIALDDQDRMIVFDHDDGMLQHTGTFDLPRNTLKLHTVRNRLYMSDEEGRIYRVRTNGRTDELFGIEEPVSRLEYWNNLYLIRGQSTRIWVAGQGMRPTLFRDDASAGNHLTTLKDQLWISEYRELCRWIDRTHIAAFDEEDTIPDPPTDVADVDEPLRLTPIENQIVPYPRSLLLSFSLESGHDIRQIRFQQRSNINGIRIRGNGLYWQPSSSDVGSHYISVIASTQDGQTDSTSFQVTVRPFNSPPRFSPVRTLSIPVNEEFSIPIRATDPDGLSSELIRYIGVDLPDGATLDERSGEFTWTPSRRQTGEHGFQVIATDQFGAASSLDVTINVVDLSRDES